MKSTLVLTPALAVGGLAVAITLAGAGGAVAGHLVTSADIKDHTIQGKDIKSATIPASELTASARKSLHTVPGYVLASKQGSMPAETGASTFTAFCPKGKVALGGGYRLDGSGVSVLADSVSDAQMSGWTFQGANDGVTTVNVIVFAECATKG
jgi:hypothetical protein